MTHHVVAMLSEGLNEKMCVKTLKTVPDTNEHSMKGNFYSCYKV